MGGLSFAIEIFANSYPLWLYRLAVVEGGGRSAALSLNMRSALRRKVMGERFSEPHTPLSRRVARPQPYEPPQLLTLAFPLPHHSPRRAPQATPSSQLTTGDPITATAKMGRAEVGSTKHLANQMKSKGLQRLRWWVSLFLLLQLSSC